MALTQIASIAAGGAIGAVLRYWMSNSVHTWFGRDFPWGTLAVNVVGSLIMGWLYVVLVERTELSPELRLGLMTGVLGALTTFSSFSLETVGLLERGQFVSALMNVTLSVVICVGVCWFAIWSARSLM